MLAKKVLKLQFSKYTKFAFIKSNILVYQNENSFIKSSPKMGEQLAFLRMILLSSVCCGNNCFSEREMDHSKHNGNHSRGPSTSRSTRSNGSRAESEKPEPDVKPYLDKMVMKINLPLEIEGSNDYVSVTTFPELYRYTRIQSIYEPVTATTCNPHGTITPMYKVEACESMKPIYRDDKELKGRVETFKKFHRQFLDDVLNDMEELRVTQEQRKLQYWVNSKSKLGFAGSFNTEQYRKTNQSEILTITRKDSHDQQPGTQQPSMSLETTSYSQDFGSTTDSSANYENDFEFEPPSSSQSHHTPQNAEYDHTNFQQQTTTQTASGRGSPKKPATPLVPNMLNRPKSGFLPANSSQLIKKLGYRPPNKMALFNALMETTPAPHSPRKRYGTMDIKKKA